MLLIRIRSCHIFEFLYVMYPAIVYINSLTAITLIISKGNFSKKVAMSMILWYN